MHEEKSKMQKTGLGVIFYHPVTRYEIF